MATSFFSEKRDARNAPVTAQEFAAAVDALEARRRQQARDAGAAADAFDQDITADEILAEVHAQRAAPRQRSRPRFLWDVLLLVLFLVGTMSLFRTLNDRAEQKTGATPPRRDVRVSDGGAASFLETLSEIPNETPVVCSEASLNELLGGAATAADESPADDAEGRWILLKHNGRVYVRGWVTTAVSDNTLRIGRLRFYASRETAEAANVPDGRPPMPLTLAVDKVRWDGVSEESCRTFTNVRLDSHAREEW